MNGGCSIDDGPKNGRRYQAHCPPANRLIASHDNTTAAERRSPMAYSRSSLAACRTSATDPHSAMKKTFRPRKNGYSFKLRASGCTTVFARK